MKLTINQIQGIESVDSRIDNLEAAKSTIVRELKELRRSRLNYCPLHIGDRVLYSPWRNTEKQVFIVHEIKFERWRFRDGDGNEHMSYFTCTILRPNKDGSTPKRTTSSNSFGSIPIASLELLEDE